MRLTGLLLLPFLSVAPLAASDTVQPASPPAQVQADAFAEQMTNAQQVFAPQQREDLVGESDGICYKIRAYIFKRDDDHAPELTGSTTCGPRQPRAKNVAWPKARLVPAN